MLLIHVLMKLTFHRRTVMTGVSPITVIDSVLLYLLFLLLSCFLRSDGVVVETTTFWHELNLLIIHVCFLVELFGHLLVIGHEEDFV